MTGVQTCALPISLGSDKISTLVISPSGGMSKEAQYSPDEPFYKGKFNLENTSYEIKYRLPWTLSGNLRIDIRLKDVKPGVWTIRLNPEYILNGNYGVYLPNKNLISSTTRFIDADSNYTITTFGLLEDVITVGTYNTKTNSMWLGSSKGPHGERGIQPDIVAPGVDIIAPFTGGGYNAGTGTGISSAIVSGILALIVEYISSQTSIAQYSLYNEPLKSYLMIGATQKSIYTYPNPTQGYGIVNFENTILQIVENLE